MDDEQNSYCPVNEAKLFSSPLITCREFQKQCFEVLGDDFRYLNRKCDQNLIGKLSPIKDSFTLAYTKDRIRRTKDTIPKDDSAQSRPNIPWNKLERIKKLYKNNEKISFDEKTTQLKFVKQPDDQESTKQTVQGENLMNKSTSDIDITNDVDSSEGNSPIKKRRRRRKRGAHNDQQKTRLYKQIHERNKKLFETIQPLGSSTDNSISTMLLNDTEREKFAKNLKTDISIIEELEEVCNPSHLKCSMEDQYDFTKYKVYGDLPSEEIPLEILKLAKKKVLTTESHNYPIYFDEHIIEPEDKNKEKVKEGDVLLNVSFSFIEKRAFQGCYVLSCQTLADLRDVIVCPEDNCTAGEFSENPSTVNEALKTKDIFRSSFFFIEGCFYNDTRHEPFTDLSKVIREWAKDPGKQGVPGLGLLRTGEMQNQKLEDLSVRLGYPYLYQHQGNCQHVVVFQDMRLVHENDPQYLSSYPHTYHESFKKRNRCSVCQIYAARWMTMNDAFAFEDPSLFCQKCFQYLHYDENGKKICSFEAYAYPGGTFE